MKRKILCTYTVLMLMLLCLSQGCGKKQDAVVGTELQETEESIMEQEGSELQDDGDVKEESTAVWEEATEKESTSGNAGKSPVGLAASPAKTGALHVEGTRLMGGNGEPIQLKGISTHGLAWFSDYINEACFRELRQEWNANVIRLAMYTAESGGYCTGGNKEQLKNLVRDGVRFAAAQDMYVIIDWHILSDSNPNTYKEEAKAFFAEVSDEYKDENHVLYEICNEPNGNTSWKDIKAYAEEIIEVIRSNDKDAVILVGTPNWSQYVDQAAADPITGYDNIMYTLHFYAATHKDDLRGKMVSAVEAGLPVFVSEYGICDASGNGAIDKGQADQWVKVMDSYGISYVAWNLSNKGETSAILKSSCSKTSGFLADDISESGQWLYQMLTGEHEFIASGGDTQSKGGDQAVQAEEPAAPQERVPESQAVTLSNGEMKISATLVNQWEENGTPVYQYSLTLQNKSGSECTQWAIDVSFQEAISLKDGWNGDYSVQGNILHITSKDYNGTVQAGASVTDVGFIVSGGGGIQAD